MTRTSDKIIEYISKANHASGKEITNYLGNITDRAVRKQLRSLLQKGILTKVGKPPKVYYQINNKVTEKNIPIDQKIKDFIDKHYLYISPAGESLEGWKGFVAWCNKTNQDPLKTVRDYQVTLNKFNKYKKNGLIDGMPKMRNTFKKVFLDKLFYLDFYSIERFGKTKLGQMLLYAKQSQNRILISRLIDNIKPDILKIISKYKIDGVIYIPPTVKREVQLMKELENNLSLPLRTLGVTKIKTEIIVPQKTLSKLEDRIENARKTIIVNEHNKYKNVLLIDDAVGSGATMNETAKQIKNKGLVSGQILGLAVTGSFKGFDIISEV